MNALVLEMHDKHPTETCVAKEVTGVDVLPRLWKQMQKDVPQEASNRKAQQKLQPLRRRCKERGKKHIHTTDELIERTIWRT